MVSAVFGHSCVNKSSSVSDHQKVVLEYLKDLRMWSDDIKYYAFFSTVELKSL